jgi:hypothetical protein
MSLEDFNTPTTPPTKSTIVPASQNLNVPSAVSGSSTVSATAITTHKDELEALYRRVDEVVEQTKIDLSADRTTQDPKSIEFSTKMLNRAVVVIKQVLHDYVYNFPKEQLDTSEKAALRLEVCRNIEVLMLAFRDVMNQNKKLYAPMDENKKMKENGDTSTLYVGRYKIDNQLYEIRCGIRAVNFSSQGVSSIPKNTALSGTPRMKFEIYPLDVNGFPIGRTRNQVTGHKEKEGKYFAFRLDLNTQRVSGINSISVDVDTPFDIPHQMEDGITQSPSRSEKHGHHFNILTYTSAQEAAITNTFREFAELFQAHIENTPRRSTKN